MIGAGVAELLAEIRQELKVGGFVPQGVRESDPEGVGQDPRPRDPDHSGPDRAGCVEAGAGALPKASGTATAITKNPIIASSWRFTETGGTLFRQPCVSVINPPGQDENQRDPGVTGPAVRRDDQISDLGDEKHEH